ncbi:MAG: polysaccharide deacetylase family protein [Patescibacteria group bacterium]
MKWFNFLHFYQPANIEAEIIKEASEKSYFRLLRLFEENKNLRMTINVSGCLLERMNELGLEDFAKRLLPLVKSGRIEIVGSAAYHAFLPLLPEKEVIFQIKEQEKILKKYLGVSRPRGFFLPEMAYSSAVAKIIKSLGYEYLILDPIAYSNKNLRDFEALKTYCDQASGLKIVFRNRAWSSKYAPDYFQKSLRTNRTGIVVTASDAELYGLRHVDQTAELEKICKDERLGTGTLGDFISLTTNPEKIILRSCSWESSERELSANNPYELWNNKRNEIHQSLWRLAKLAIKVVHENPKDHGYVWARWHLSRGLASCSWWWSSGHDFSRHFGPLAWSPDELERGTNDLLRAVRSLEDKKTRRKKILAEKIASRLRSLVWTKHWQKYF